MKKMRKQKGNNYNTFLLLSSDPSRFKSSYNKIILSGISI